MNPGLMDEEKNFLSEAFATLSAEMCGHLSFNTCYQLVKGMMKTNSSQKLFPLISKSAKIAIFGEVNCTVAKIRQLEPCSVDEFISAHRPLF